MPDPSEQIRPVTIYLGAGLYTVARTRGEYEALKAEGGYGLGAEAAELEPERRHGVPLAFNEEEPSA